MDYENKTPVLCVLLLLPAKISFIRPYPKTNFVFALSCCCLLLVILISYHYMQYALK